ncbi:hepatic sodium/bile acid cotransporter-like [Haemaphysalis longicornis]
MQAEAEKAHLFKVLFASPANRTITVASDDTGVATVSLSPAYQGAGANGTTVKVHGVFLGYANLRFTVCTALEGEAGSPQHCATFVYKVAVLRVRSVWNKMFPFLVSVLVAVNFISMGCNLELEVLVAAAKKPLPPALGLACQFLFMPLASYGIGALLLQNPLTRFAVFVMGCCPGGNASNLWTLMFNGDVPLSITMTFLSTLASIGMIPLWLFLLGNRMSPETRRYRIPYVGIVLSLVGIMAPLAVGMALKKKKPDWATRLAKHLKTITIMVLCLLIIFTAVVNYYIFVLLTWRTLACVALISWSAYLFGGLAALVGRLERKQIIAVAIEVAFQNSAIAVIIIYTALPLPDADIMISPIAGQAILQGVPLYLLYAALAVRSRLGAPPEAADDTSAAKAFPVPSPPEHSTFFHP